MEDKNTVIIGNKPFRVYRFYVQNLLSSGQLENIKILARGPKNIYKAISLVEVLKRTNNNIEPKIVSKTEEQELEGKKRMVTAVEITFGKQ